MYSKERRSWSDQFLGEVCELVYPNLQKLEIANELEDCEHATDLICLENSDQRLAVRIRKREHLDRYWDEFTIRSYSNGYKTEIHKIREAWGTHMFYGFADGFADTHIVLWWLLDLWVWRKYEAEVKPVIKDNHDGTLFSAYEIKNFPTNLIIKSGNSLNFDMAIL